MGLHLYVLCLVIAICHTCAVCTVAYVQFKSHSGVVVSGGFVIVNAHVYEGKVSNLVARINEVCNLVGFFIFVRWIDRNARLSWRQAWMESHFTHGLLSPFSGELLHIKMTPPPPPSPLQEKLLKCMEFLFFLLLRQFHVSCLSLASNQPLRTRLP